MKLYTPGYLDIMSQYRGSSTVAVLGLSLYVAGLAFGPVLAAPISETRRRRAVYLISVPIAALFTLGAGLSPNMTPLAICRFFAGFFGSPVLAVGAGTDVVFMASPRFSSCRCALHACAIFGPSNRTSGR